MNIDIRITGEPLGLADCLDIVSDTACGGINTFIGTVRDHTKGCKVTRLEYECYESMALKEIRKICGEALSRYGVKNILVHHRVGVLIPGDVAVIVIVSDGHREQLFDSCRYIIDNLKQKVPIWKKEIYEDGEAWVSAHP